MRRLLLVVGLASIVGLAAYYDGPRPASASQTCTATCNSPSSLSCTVAAGTCSSSAGTVTCCGQVHTCDAINAWNACWFRCVHGFSRIQMNCSQICGAAPKTSFSC